MSAVAKSLGGSEKTYKSLESDIEDDVFRGSENRCVWPRSQHKNHVLWYGFLTDRTDDSLQLRRFVVIDDTTRECLSIEVARSFTAQDVIGVPQYLFVVRGTSQHIHSDNDPEFVVKTVRRWLQ